jgi:hypothetical protein
MGSVKGVETRYYCSGLSMEKASLFPLHTLKYNYRMKLVYHCVHITGNVPMVNAVSRKHWYDTLIKTASRGIRSCKALKLEEVYTHDEGNVYI